jgi:FtsP/CotA-like multicopper oxidase with cupredoxin domain
MRGEAVDHQDAFTTETAGLPEASSPSVVRLRDGDSYDLHIYPVRKKIGDAEVRMLSYNGSIPGPTLRADQGSEIIVNVTNETDDLETTVHWHGLRLQNRYDGVPEETQAPIAPGGTFTYKLQFPDPGLYWYHPHIREDIAQEMGLYAPIVVEPSEPSYWPAADGQLTLTLDDVLIEDGRMAPFLRSGPTHTAMGRFGNVMLINGQSRFSGEAGLGEVVRLYLVNTANTRIFNFALGGSARMKLVGGDSGRYERETFVDEVLLAPSERMIVDAQFERPGEVRLEHRTPDHVYDLGSFSVSGTATGDATGDAAGSFEVLRTDPELASERQAIKDDIGREPDKVLSLVASMPLLYGEEVQASSYACPMHPEVMSTSPGTCPKCGMKLVPADALPASRSHEGHVHSARDHVNHARGEQGHDEHHHGDHGGHEHGTHDHGGHAHGDHGDGLEWEDLMPEVNRATDPSNMIWKLVDRQTGAENHAISWKFKVGDRVKIRLVNEMDSDHPMHHPFHVHGAGRFLILSRDGKPEPNLVWKDTVLLRAGETVDILLYVTNPGLWMAHCHIAEHTESGMMFSFEVAPSSEGRR